MATVHFCTQPRWRCFGSRFSAASSDELGEEVWVGLCNLGDPQVLLTPQLVRGSVRISIDRQLIACILSPPWSFYRVHDPYICFLAIQTERPEKPELHKVVRKGEL